LEKKKKKNTERNETRTATVLELGGVCALVGG
jgi:hypothetical protein